MKEHKNDLIDSFNKIEQSTFNLLSNVRIVNELYTQDCVSLISEINCFHSKATTIIKGFYIDHNIISGFFVSCPESISRIQKSLDFLTFNIENIISELTKLESGVVSSAFDDLYMSICSSEGNISLTLRFELPAEPILDSQQANAQDINNRLDTLQALNKDYFQINHVWQHSMRKFLPSISMSDTAIILQGPIMYDDDFTLETLYRYRMIYPDTLIVVSTWTNEPTHFFMYLATSVNILVIESQMPQDTGAANIKCQLTSTRAGLDAVKEFPNIKYAIKTRSDQRIFLPDFLLFLRNMQVNFKCSEKELSDRLVFLGGWNSMCSFPFRVSDFMVFGALHDLEKYYSCSGDSPYLERNYASQNAFNEHTIKIGSRIQFDNIDVLLSVSTEERKYLNERNKNSFDPETYICCTFYENYILKRALCDNDDRLEHYWHFLKKYAIVVNADQLMLFWHKYKFQKYNWNNLVCDGGLTNSFWLSLCLSDFERSLK